MRTVTNLEREGLISTIDCRYAALHFAQFLLAHDSTQHLVETVRCGEYLPQTIPAWAYALYQSMDVIEGITYVERAEILLRAIEATLEIKK